MNILKQVVFTPRDSDSISPDLGNENLTKLQDATGKLSSKQFPELPIINEPSDSDWERWSMLHDQEKYRLYCFRQNSDDSIYQFLWNGESYEYLNELTLKNLPDDADSHSLSLVFGEQMYQLYLRQHDNPCLLYRFKWESNVNQYVYQNSFKIVSFPEDTDWSRWDMLNDGKDYYIYALKTRYSNQIYQGIWNPQSGQYEYLKEEDIHLSLEKDSINKSEPSSFATLHDGSSYYLYLQVQGEVLCTPELPKDLQLPGIFEDFQ